MGGVGGVGIVLVHAVYFAPGAGVMLAQLGQHDIYSHVSGVQPVLTLFRPYCILFISLSRNADIPVLVLLPVLGAVGTPSFLP